MIVRLMVLFAGGMRFRGAVRHRCGRAGLRRKRIFGFSHVHRVDSAPASSGRASYARRCARKIARSRCWRQKMAARALPDLTGRAGSGRSSGFARNGRAHRQATPPRSSLLAALETGVPRGARWHGSARPCIAIRRPAGLSATQFELATGFNPQYDFFNKRVTDAPVLSIAALSKSDAACARRDVVEPQLFVKTVAAVCLAFAAFSGCSSPKAQDQSSPPPATPCRRASLRSCRRSSRTCTRSARVRRSSGCRRFQRTYAGSRSAARRGFYQRRFREDRRAARRSRARYSVARATGAAADSRGREGRAYSERHLRRDLHQLASSRRADRSSAPSCRRDFGAAEDDAVSASAHRVVQAASVRRSSCSGPRRSGRSATRRTSRR